MIQIVPQIFRSLLVDITVEMGKRPLGLTPICIQVIAQNSMYTSFKMYCCLLLGSKRDEVTHTHHEFRLFDELQCYIALCLAFHCHGDVQVCSLQMLAPPPVRSLLCGGSY